MQGYRPAGNESGNAIGNELQLLDNSIVDAKFILGSVKVAGVRKSGLMAEIHTWNNSDKTESVMVLWELDFSEGYDWSLYAIVLNGKGEYALYTDAGCSCNGPYWEGWNAHDLAWTKDLSEIKRAVRECVGKNQRISVGRKADNIAKLAKLR